MSWDRDEVLARVDLGTLADELLGGHQGHGTGSRWPSPVPDHPQTGQSPPMSIFTSRSGEQRWTCFATGASGTAIDLVMVARRCGVREAMEALATRAGLGESEHHVYRRPPRPSPPPTPMPSPPPDQAVLEYVAACAELLWTRSGTAVRRWLMGERGFTEPVLRANQVGADPGPAALTRPAGLPKGGPGAVFPAFDEIGTLVYFQTRFLRPTRAKYASPSSTRAANPRMAHVRVPAGPRPVEVTVVTEGIPDGLAVAGVGLRAVAILGAGVPDQRVARRLAQLRGRLVVALDGDAAGDTGRRRLSELLDQAGAGGRVAEVVPPGGGDLNDWTRRAGPRFATEFRLALQCSTGPPLHAAGPGLGR